MTKKGKSTTMANLFKLVMIPLIILIFLSQRERYLNLVILDITNNIYQDMPAGLALVSINEKEERKAQQAFYEKIAAEMSKKKARKLAVMKRVALVYNPLVALTFAAVYWVAGLRHAGII